MQIAAFANGLPDSSEESGDESICRENISLMNVYLILDDTQLEEENKHVVIEEIYKKIKQNQMFFDSLEQLKEAYDKGRLKTLMYVFTMMSPMLKELRAIRCFYICALAEEI